MTIDTLISDLDLKLIDQLKGKTKKVYLVEQNGEKYILKAGKAPQEIALIDKEMKIYNLMGGVSKKVLPDLIYVKKVGGYTVILQEYLGNNNLYSYSYENDLQKIYSNFANALNLLHNTKRKMAGGINIEKQFDHWRDYLNYKLEIYLANINKQGVILPTGISENIHRQLKRLEEPTEYSLLHMDLHGGNVFVDNSFNTKFIDVDEAIFGDKDYDLARILKAHFNDELTCNLKDEFLEKIGASNYIASEKAKTYSNLRTLHYIEILARTKQTSELATQISSLDF